MQPGFQRGHPDPGFHAALRDLTRRTGTLLILDETHTISAGPGGYTGEHGLEPDMRALMEKLITSRTRDWSPEVAEDPVQDELLDLIKAKHNL